MKRRVRHVVLGAAIVLLGCIPVWKFLVSPYLLRIPDDFYYSADLSSWDNLYDQKTETFPGKTQSDAQFSYRVIDTAPGLLTIENSFTARSAAGDPIISIIRKYGISPTTHKHVVGFGDHDRTGYLFAPAHLRPGQNFTYWHVNYDVPAEMHYKDAENIDGLKVFHYQTTLTPDQTANLQNLPQVGQTLGINLDVALDVWVEPTTGWLVKYADKAVGYYYDLGSQQRLYPWNSFSNVFTDDAVAQQVSNARQQKLITLLIDTVIPWAFGVIVLICIAPILLSDIQRLHTFFRVTTPYVVGVTGIGISVLCWFFASSIVDAKKADSFQADAASVVSTIQQRMQTYRNILDGAVSVFGASEHVYRDEWNSYIAGLHTDITYPGVQGFGFAQYVLPKDLADYESTVRKENFPDFSVYPSTQTDVYIPVTYLYPWDQRNQRAFGFNLYSEEQRKVALDAARDTGAPQLTGKVVLAQEDGIDPQAGTLLFDPIYAEKSYTVSDRRSNIVGFAYAPFRMNDLMNGIFKGAQLHVAFDVYDDSIGRNPDGLMYRSTSMDVDHASDTGGLTTTRQLALFGRRWAVVIAQLPSTHYRSAFERALPWILLAAGTLLSTLIGAFLFLAERGFFVISPYNPRPQHRRS